MNESLKIHELDDIRHPVTFSEMLDFWFSGNDVFYSSNKPDE